jgi:hypothetical protein
MSQKSDAGCDGAVCPTPASVDDRESAKTSATISTISFAAGIVALGVGIYLVLSDQSHAKLAAAAQLPMTRWSVPRGGGALGVHW